MVKYVCACLLMLAFAAPAFSQDYAQVELSLGYGNIGLNDSSGIIPSGRHSGFTTHQAFNLNSILGIENFVGYYGFGTPPLGLGKEQLLTDIFGAKFNYRKKGPVLYGVAGFGGGWLRFPQSGGSTGGAMAFRLGGGADIPIHDSLAIKVDVSRMGFHFFEGWKAGMNISTGLVFKISQ